MELFLDIGKCSFKTQVLVSKMPTEFNIEYPEKCLVPPDAMGNGSSDGLVFPRTVKTALYNVRDSIKSKDFFI